MPDNIKWELETKGIIWDTDDVEEEEDEIPQIAKEHGFLCSISIQKIQEIVSNARQQVKDCSIEQLFAAFLYYYDNDAFLEF